jgi:hypothetical protein
MTKTGNVQMLIYDYRGKEVNNLVNENKIPGTYEVEFNGENFASGIYFYKLIVDGELIDTKKMALIK